MELPEQWKTFLAIPIPKPGKEKSKIEKAVDDGLNNLQDGKQHGKSQD